MKKEEYQFAYERYDSWKELACEESDILQKALESSRNAYAPYSGFHVGACVLLENGDTVCGNNQENASYPQGLCAERVALFSASAQKPTLKIKALALCTADSDEILSPCGGCRQVLLEYEQKQGSSIRILMGTPQGKAIRIQSAEQLLPFCFSKENLSDSK